MIKKTLSILVLVLLLLATVVIFRTFSRTSKQLKVAPIAILPIGDESIQHLSEAVKIQTVSYEDNLTFDTLAYLQFLAFLKSTYPLSDSLLHPQTINNFSLLYRWNGSNPELQPIILMAHYDVVPSKNGTEEHWDFDPFGGVIADGHIHGRGTLDDKVNVIGIMEAVEHLLKAGYKPERTIYLAFGHDEEIGGNNGASYIASYLESKKVHASFVIDEGLLVTEQIIPDTHDPVALIGISEKGYLSVELTTTSEGGHSSMPPLETNIGILSNAIAKVERRHLPARFCEPVNEFLDYLGPEMPFVKRMAFANRWLFKNVIVSAYEKSNSGYAMVHTTHASTIFKSGIKDNVLPSSAMAIINFRILPGKTIQEVLTFLKTEINDDRVQIKVHGIGDEASPVSDINSEGFKKIELSIRQIFPNTIVVPSLVLGGTDSKHYQKVADNIYRFAPIRCNSKDLDRIHGVNERIGIDNFKDCIRFYHQLILNLKS